MEDTDKKTSNKVTSFKKRENLKLTSFNKNSLQKEGFSYRTMKKDINGFEFKSEHLQEYALEMKYTVTLALKEKGKTILHCYFIEGEDLKKFFQYYIEGKIEGDIIEIDKYNPEILA